MVFIYQHPAGCFTETGGKNKKHFKSDQALFHLILMPTFSPLNLKEHPAGVPNGAANVRGFFNPATTHLNKFLPYPLSS